MGTAGLFFFCVVVFCALKNYHEASKSRKSEVCHHSTSGVQTTPERGAAAAKTKQKTVDILTVLEEDKRRVFAPTRLASRSHRCSLVGPVRNDEYLSRCGAEPRVGGLYIQHNSRSDQSA